jgi:phosphoglycerate dehydrogenase-like enzyme
MKVLVIKAPATLAELPDEEYQAIKEASGGAEVIVANNLGEAEQHLGDAEVILGSLPEDAFLKAKSLKWMHAVSSGADALLYPAMVESEVMLTGEKGLVGEHLADHAFALLLGLARQLPRAIRAAPEPWPLRLSLRADMVELHGLTTGVVGLGGTGRAVAKRAAAFGMDVVAVDSEPVEGTPEVPQVWGMDRFDDLLRISDVVMVCCPLTKETRGMFDDRAFDLMKPTSLIVNVTRGPIIDGDALARALSSGKIRGAGLDVTPIEPLPADHALWQQTNILITPHTAGASQARVHRNVSRFVANLRKYREGAALEGEIDKIKGF